MHLLVTAKAAFGLQAIGVIGWIPLFAFPTSRWRDPLVVSASALVAVLYAYIIACSLLLPSGPGLDFSTLESWSALTRDPYMLVAITSHFIVVDLLIARWMTVRFYSACSLSRARRGRWYFAGVLAVTFMVAPCGVLLYFISELLWFSHYTIADEDAYKALPTNARSLLDERQVYYGDSLPVPLRTLLFAGRAAVGAGALLVVGAVFALGVVPVAWFYFHLRCRHLPKGPNAPLSPRFLRVALARWRLTLLLTPEASRGLLWGTVNRLLQVGFFAELGASFDKPHLLVNALRHTFGDFFPFGEGIGVANRQDVIGFLQDQGLRKGPLSLGWRVSTAQKTFCNIMPVFQSSSGADAESLAASRAIIFKWLNNFPIKIATMSQCERLALERALPSLGPGEPARTDLYDSFGTGLYYLATGDSLRPHERAAYVDAVVNGMIFLPDWVNFLIGGSFLERKGLRGYYTLRSALARHLDGPAISAALSEARRLRIAESEALRLIAIIFSIAGAAAPATLTESVVRRLYEKPDERGLLFDRAPREFVLETARLGKGVPMVNVLSRSPLAVSIGGEAVELPYGTPLHCSLVAANRDSETFGGTSRDQSIADEFDPLRENLGDLFFWNGLESQINGAHQNRPPRYCPGHDVSLDLVIYLAARHRAALTARTGGQHA